MKLANMFIETRFETSFLFDDGRTRNDILKELKGGQNYQLIDNGDSKMMLFVSLKEKINIVIQHDRILISVENPKETNKIKTIGSSVIPFVLKRFEQKETTRIGVRSYYIIEKITGIESISTEIQAKYFDEKLVKLINKQEIKPPLASAISFSFGINHELSLSVNIGSHLSGKATLNGTGQIEFDQSVIPSLLFDLDLFVTTPKSPDQINGVLNACCSKSDEYVNTLWNKEL